MTSLLDLDPLLSRDDLPEAPPEPEEHATAVDLTDLPGGPVRIYKLAERERWEVRATRSRGPWLGANGTVARIATSWKIVAIRGDDLIAALWVTDTQEKPKLEMAWSHPVGEWSDRITYGELRDVLKGVESAH